MSAHHILAARCPRPGVHPSAVSTFESGSASQGGGLMAVTSYVTITNTDFIDNTALDTSSDEQKAGGAIEFHSCPTMILTGCAFEDNHAEAGGALALNNPDDTPGHVFTISQCAFNSNIADGKGGAMRRKALRAMVRSVEMGKDQPAYWQTLGNLHRKMHSWEEAFDALEHFARLSVARADAVEAEREALT